MIIDCRDLLRLDDNPLLSGVSQPVLVWVQEARLWADRMSPRRQAFTLEAVADLRAQCRALGGDLVIRSGNRADVLNRLSRELNVPVRTARPSGWEERQEDEQIERLETLDARSLYTQDGLPFDPAHVPEPFTAFRNQVQKKATVDEPLTAPSRLPPLPAGLEPGDLPSVPDVPDEPRAVLAFKGGETAALAHLEAYFAEPQVPSTYKKTRNGLLGARYSTKFSPWLAQGSVSPRRIWHRVRQFEAEHVKNDSTYWIKFELLWREYFRWWVRPLKQRLYASVRPFQTREPWLDAWKNGQTGVPFVDANMRELTASGFMSNRGRQNVASFLAKDLGLDWRKGADFFEYHLLDYDDASNWGNWAYVAGVGADPRDDRWFNVLLQAQRYDKRGDYVRHWLADLHDMDPGVVHWPWTAGLSAPPLVQPKGWSKVING